MKKISFLLFFFLLQSNTSEAKFDTKTSIDMHEWCKSWIRQRDGFKISNEKMIKSIGCYWYFKGMYEGSLMGTVADAIPKGIDSQNIQPKLNGACVPRSFTLVQWIKIFVRYLDNNPQHLNKDVAFNSAVALTKFYKCKN